MSWEPRRAARAIRTVLTELGLLPTGRHVVLNFGDRRRGLALDDVEVALGTTVDVVIPRADAVPASANEGRPLLQDHGRDPATKALRRLLDRFATRPVTEPEVPKLIEAIFMACVARKPTESYVAPLADCEVDAIVEKVERRTGIEATASSGAAQP